MLYFKKVQFLHLDLFSDPATQTNADPDPQPCYRHKMKMAHFDRITRRQYSTVPT
jgi:hypothetical protein